MDAVASSELFITFFSLQIFYSRDIRLLIPNYIIEREFGASKEKVQDLLQGTDVKIEVSHHYFWFINNFIAFFFSITSITVLFALFVPVSNLFKLI